MSKVWRDSSAARSSMTVPAATALSATLDHLDRIEARGVARRDDRRQEGHRDADARRDCHERRLDLDGETHGREREAEDQQIAESDAGCGADDSEKRGLPQEDSAGGPV